QVVPVTIKPGDEITIFNWIYNSYHYYNEGFGSQNLAGFGSTEKNIMRFAENRSPDIDYITFTQDSILFGVLFIAALLNFFVFLIVRERVFLYFSLYLVLMGTGRMLFEFYFIFLREHRVF